MPGFSLIFNASSATPLVIAKGRRALGHMRHDERYRVHTVEQSSNCLLAWTGYPGYPVAVHQTNSAILLVEGFVYHSSGQSLADLIGGILKSSSALNTISQKLRDFTTNADGEFAIIYYRKGPDPFLVAALDALGRLPVYWTQEGGSLLVSRELKFIAATASEVRPDITAVAQTMLLRCPWDNRTLLAGSRRVPAGGMLMWQPATGPEVSLTHYPWCFADDPPTENPAALTGRLVDQFRDACRNRVEAFAGRRLHLTLSGGLDSRAVAAGLAAAAAEVATHTFVMDRQHPQTAAAVAERIASACGLEWKPSRLKMPSPDAVNRLIVMKDGQNSGEMAYAEEFFRALLGECDEHTALFTGEGGDLVITGRQPGRPIATDAELADLLLERLAVFPPETVSRLTGLPARDIFDQLVAVLEGFPERTIAGRQLHFSMMVFYFREYFEGEDRNRCYMWTTAPFYARPFFDLAMAAPTHWKHRRRLQTAFLRRLSPAVAAIPNANNGLVTGSWRDRARQWARELILSQPGWERHWRSRRSGVSSLKPLPVELAGNLRALATDSPAIGDLFDREKLMALLMEGLSPAQGWLLYTLTRYADSLGRH